MDSGTLDNVFPGNDFSNNIFTDLAPLLTLFGDQMTKQFLSMSMGWADNALIAVCPIGILTVMVSAIRIGGASKVKTLIGRYGCPPQTKFAESHQLNLLFHPVPVRVEQQPSLSCCQLLLEKCAKCGAVRRLSESLGNHPRSNI